MTVVNPFPYSRYGFLWQCLYARSPGRHLDYGCNDGATLRVLSDTGVIREGIGVDVNVQLIESGQLTTPENVKLSVIRKREALPFPDGSFDSVSLLDVIEHIHDQQFVLDDVCRVLRPDGIVVVTVPKKHLLSFLDVGNLKFVFPRTHRFLYSLKNGREAFQQRYVNCPNGLFGDIESEKGWHQHFTEAEMVSLLRQSNLKQCRLRGSGFFYRPLHLLSFVTPGFAKKLLGKVVAADAQYFRSANLFCLAKPN